MKRPDEIKRGLEAASVDCRGAHECEKMCAYYKQCSSHASELATVPCDMLSDALAYIKRLEREKQRMEREWVAAVEDLKMLGKCPTCAHYETPCGTGPCMSCHPIERQGYVWRGVKEGETREQDS